MCDTRVGGLTCVIQYCNSSRHYDDLCVSLSVFLCNIQSSKYCERYSLVVQQLRFSLPNRTVRCTSARPRHTPVYLSGVNLCILVDQSRHNMVPGLPNLTATPC